MPNCLTMITKIENPVSFSKTHSNILGNHFIGVIVNEPNDHQCWHNRKQVLHQPQCQMSMYIGT